MGDDVQTIKAGIMEIADIFVINKSDREGAERVEREIRNMQTLAGNIREDQWTAPIVKTVASTGTGIPELVETIAKYEQHLLDRDLLQRKRASNWRERMVEMLREALLQKLMRESLSPAALSTYAAEIASHQRDPYTLVDELVDRFRKG
jgi:LAO/AO transport system kinase